MTGDADILVVGSGPSGVSVAWPLVKSGLRVLMLDQGRRGPEIRDAAGGFMQMRRGCSL